MNKIYIIGVGGIGVSAVARYYNTKGYQVFASDKTNSELIEALKKEGIDIIIGENEDRIDSSFEKVVYTEAISSVQSELVKSRFLGIHTLSYPEALSEIANDFRLISVTGSHGKSTTSSLTSLVFKNSDLNFTSVVGTLVKEFGNKNFFHIEKNTKEDKYFIIEACEYKRSFLRYNSFIGVITNIDLDHLDYYKNLEDYLSAFESFVNNIVLNGFAVLNGECGNSMKLFALRKDLNYIVVKGKIYSVYYSNGLIEEFIFPNINMQVPGDHILFDAKLAYIVGIIVGIDKKIIVDTLQQYSGVWRRGEIIGITQNGNTLMSDYGHHPTEILLTTKALKEKYPDKTIVCIFQPHQFNRTLELIDGFKTCFKFVDKLIIPNIYESRDSENDKSKINSKKLVEIIEHSNKLDGEGLENTLTLIQEYDLKNPNSCIIILQGAGNIDDLRFKIKT